MLARVGCVLGRVAGVLSAEMGKATKGKAGAKAGETWYSKQCRDNPNFKAERADAAKKARAEAAAARAAAAAAAATAPAAETAEAAVATSPGFLAHTLPSVFGAPAPAPAPQEHAGRTAGGYTTEAALGGPALSGAAEQQRLPCS